MANLLTGLRIVLALPTAISILSGDFLIAFILTLISGASDLLDGWLARLQGNGDGAGKLLDPLADKVFLLSTLVALVEVGKVSSLIVILLLIRELSISFLRSFWASQGSILGASYLGKLKTAMMFSGVLLLLRDYGPGIYLLWLSVGLAYLSFYEYIRSYLKAPSGLNYP